MEKECSGTQSSSSPFLLPVHSRNVVVAIVTSFLVTLVACERTSLWAMEPVNSKSLLLISLPGLSKLTSKSYTHWEKGSCQRTGKQDKMDPTHFNANGIASTFGVWVLVGYKFRDRSKRGSQVLCQPYKIIKKTMKSLCESELKTIVLFISKGLLQVQKKMGTARNGNQHGLQFT